MKPALAIHTTSPELGLALSDFDQESRYQVWDLGRSLSTHLHVYLNEFIQPHSWSDVSFIAVAKGPGGFTGTRIGVVAARTLAQQLDIPLFAISTLAAIAWSKLSLDQAGDRDVAVQMPAQRGEVFVAIYSIRSASPEDSDRSNAAVTRPKLIAPLPDTVMPLEQWQQVLQTWQHPYHLMTAEGGLGAFVTSLLELAYLDWQQGDRPDWSTALPYYGQSYVT